MVGMRLGIKACAYRLVAVGLFGGQEAFESTGGFAFLEGFPNDVKILALLEEALGALIVQCTAAAQVTIQVGDALLFDVSDHFLEAHGALGKTFLELIDDVHETAAEVFAHDWRHHVWFLSIISPAEEQQAIKPKRGCFWPPYRAIAMKTRTFLLVALLATGFLPMVEAGSQANPEITDAADDQTLSGGSPLQTVLDLFPGGDAFEDVDILNAWVNETDDETFTIGIEAAGEVTEDTTTTITFSADLGPTSEFGSTADSTLTTITCTDRKSVV